MNDQNNVIPLHIKSPAAVLDANALEAIFGQVEHKLEPDYEGFSERAEALAQVADEMERQDARWGQQNHPFIRPLVPGGSYPYAAEVRAHFDIRASDEKMSNDVLVREANLDWRGILLEEVYEALAEADPEAACVELIQVAGVAIQAALSIRRNGLDGAAALPVADAA